MLQPTKSNNFSSISYLIFLPIFCNLVSRPFLQNTANFKEKPWGQEIFLLFATERVFLLSYL